MKSRELIKLLEQDGWTHNSTTGSHHHFEHAIKKGKITVPHPKKDIPKGTLNSILKAAGLK